MPTSHLFKKFAVSSRKQRTRSIGGQSLIYRGSAQNMLTFVWANKWSQKNKAQLGACYTKTRRIHRSLICGSEAGFSAC
jgi:hypothetical protein